MCQTKSWNAKAYFQSIKEEELIGRERENFSLLTFCSFPPKKVILDQNAFCKKKLEKCFRRDSSIEVYQWRFCRETSRFYFLRDFFRNPNFRKSTI